MELPQTNQDHFQELCPILKQLK